MEVVSKNGFLYIREKVDEMPRDEELCKKHMLSDFIEIRPEVVQHLKVVQEYDGYLYILYPEKVSIQLTRLLRIPNTIGNSLATTDLKRPNFMRFRLFGNLIAVTRSGTKSGVATILFENGSIQDFLIESGSITRYESELSL